MSSDIFPEDLPPLKVRCTDSNCERDLHCYRATAKMVRDKTAGRCRSCGISLVDWDRVHLRDLSDATFTFKVMKTELIRHHFWHLDIDAKALEHARKNGLTAILNHMPKRLKQAIGKAAPFRDGTQTPFANRAEYYAQHATATCCRKCVEDWHDIPRGRDLTEEEITYLSSLAVLYLKERLADIPDEPLKPPFKKRRGSKVDIGEDQRC